MNEQLQDLEKLLETKVLHVDFGNVEYHLRRTDDEYVIVDAYGLKYPYPDIATAVFNFLGMIGEFV